jgi:hypothetical protein
MSVPEIKLNGKNWLAKGLLQALLIVALIAYIGIKELSSGGKGSSDSNERIARIEECIITLRPLPSEVAGMKATLDGVKSAVDKMEKKLDSHIDKGK